MDRGHIAAIADKLEFGGILSEEEAFAVAKLLRMTAQRSGMVICGASQDDSTEGLPRNITVRPALGADAVGVYVRVE